MRAALWRASIFGVCLQRIASGSPGSPAGKALGSGRITPGAWERKSGLRLRFVYRRTGANLLVVDYVSMEQKIDNARLTSGGGVRANIGTRKGAVFSRLAGRAAVFLLVSQVTVRSSSMS